ncbi:MAG: hypothetical protein JSR66_04420 [Proteobacteria bacterium]|nr:hypothetical protein [Pseudomonadota bacterium]
MANLYNGFIDRIAKAYDNALSSIEAVHNFEHGDEFEIALCNSIRSILPQRFGICRGYVVDRSGKVEGDDIIIYESHLYPTGRFLPGDLALKEQVPIEAVAAYIEAKNTLEIYGDPNGGPNGEPDCTLDKALDQVSKVKTLCDQRTAVPMNAVTRHINLGTGFHTPSLLGWPTKRNPVYAAIISRHVRINKKEKQTSDSSAIESALATKGSLAGLAPDLIVAGSSNVTLSFVSGPNGAKTIRSPFIVPGGALASMKADKVAIGIGLCHLLWALDFISLGPISWSDLLADAFGLTPGAEY